MAETCPFSETSMCRDETETDTSDLRDRDFENSVSRRDMSRHTIALKMKLN